MRMEQLIVSQLPCNYVCHATYRPVRAPSLQLVAQLGYSFLNIGKDSPMDNERIGYRETVKNVSRISRATRPISGDPNLAGKLSKLFFV